MCVALDFLDFTVLATYLFIFFFYLFFALVIYNLQKNNYRNYCRLRNFCGFFLLLNKIKGKSFLFFQLSCWFATGGCESCDENFFLWFSVAGAMEADYFCVVIWIWMPIKQLLLPQFLLYATEEKITLFHHPEKENILIMTLTIWNVLCY
jgi:hypothetical protein